MQKNTGASGQRSHAVIEAVYLSQGLRRWEQGREESIGQDSASMKDDRERKTGSK